MTCFGAILGTELNKIIYHESWFYSVSKNKEERYEIETLLKAKQRNSPTHNKIEAESFHIQSFNVLL